MSERPEFRLWELAARQEGAVTRRQALALGMTRHQIDRRIATGAWHRTKPGVYRLPGHNLTEHGRLAAACAALGAAVSHSSAGTLHRLPHLPLAAPSVIVSTRTTNRFPGIIVHQLTDLEPRDVVEVDQLPVTSPARTLYDLAAVSSQSRFEVIVDRALAARRVALHDLADVLSRLGRRGKPGTRKVRAVVDARLNGYQATESVLEEMVLGLIRKYGLPAPLLQYELPWRAPRAGRVDFAYPGLRLIIEADGRAWHATFEGFDTDRMRDNHAQIAGWRVIRITFRMLVETPDEVVRLISEALRLPAAG